MYFGEKGKGVIVNGRIIFKFDLVIDLKDMLLIVNLSVIRKFLIMWEVVKVFRGLWLYGVVLLEYMDVVIGWVGVYFFVNLVLWDIVVGKIIVEELGGKVIWINGEKINMLEKGSFIVVLLKIY